VRSQPNDALAFRGNIPKGNGRGGIRRGDRWRGFASQYDQAECGRYSGPGWDNQMVDKRKIKIKKGGKKKGAKTNELWTRLTYCTSWKCRPILTVRGSEKRRKLEPLKEKRNLGYLNKRRGQGDHGPARHTVSVDAAPLSRNGKN